MNKQIESVFDSSEFVDGFIEFAASEQYQKYMKPYLAEMIETQRRMLESTSEPFLVQQRLKVLRQIDGKASELVMGKDVAVNGEK